MAIAAFVDWLSKAWVGGLLGLIGLAVGVASLGAAYYFYRRSIREPRLRYSTRAFSVIGGTLRPLLDGMEVRYRDAPVPRLAAATVTLWNSGTGTLGREAIAAHDPLRIQLEGEGQILEVALTKTTRRANNVAFEFDPEGGVITIGFDFLDPQDGAVIRLLHTSPEARP